MDAGPVAAVMGIAAGVGLLWWRARRRRNKPITLSENAASRHFADQMAIERKRRWERGNPS